MRLKFVAIGQNLKWPCGKISLARKLKTSREFKTLALARVKSLTMRKRMQARAIVYLNVEKVMKMSPTE